MTEEKTTEEAWRKVGEQFQTLGESLAEAFRTAWESEKNRQRAQEMRGGVEAMIDRISAVINDFGDSPGAHQVREEAEKAAESARVAGEQTWQKAQPHLLSALNRLNGELQKLIGHLQEPEGETAPDTPAGE